MSDDPELQQILDLLLAGTPLRVVEAIFGQDPSGLRLVDEARESLAAVGLLAAPVTPSPGLRARIAQSLAARPRAARKSAVLVMDMLVDHLTPGAALYAPRARQILPALEARLDEARALGEPVVYLVDHHLPHDPDLEVWPLHNAAENPLDQIWPSLKPEAQDTVVTHRAYSGFFETNLDATLRGLGVDSVVLTGCLTEIHLFATATDALQRGYRVEIPRALQAGTNEMVEHIALTVLSVMPPVAPMPRP